MKGKNFGWELPCTICCRRISRSTGPRSVGVAAGYTVRGLNTPHSYHETFIALDLDLRKLPGDSKFLKTMWEMLNYIHLPMPAVRVSQSANLVRTLFLSEGFRIIHHVLLSQRRSAANRFQKKIFAPLRLCGRQSLFLFDQHFIHHDRRFKPFHFYRLERTNRNFVFDIPVCCF